MQGDLSVTPPFFVACNLLLIYRIKLYDVRGGWVNLHNVRRNFNEDFSIFDE